MPSSVDSHFGPTVFTPPSPDRTSVDKSTIMGRPVDVEGLAPPAADATAAGIGAPSPIPAIAQKHNGDRITPLFYPKAMDGAKNPSLIRLRSARLGQDPLNRSAEDADDNFNVTHRQLKEKSPQIAKESKRKKPKLQYPAEVDLSGFPQMRFGNHFESVSSTNPCLPRFHGSELRQPFRKLNREATGLVDTASAHRTSTKDVTTYKTFYGVQSNPQMGNGASSDVLCFQDYNTGFMPYRPVATANNPFAKTSLSGASKDEVVIDSSRPSKGAMHIPEHEPPLGYVCLRCGQQGHWIQTCSNPKKTGHTKSSDAKPTATTRPKPPQVHNIRSTNVTDIGDSSVGFSEVKPYTLSNGSLGAYGECNDGIKGMNSNILPPDTKSPLNINSDPQPALDNNVRVVLDAPVLRYGITITDLPSVGGSKPTATGFPYSDEPRPLTEGERRLIDSLPVPQDTQHDKFARKSQAKDVHRPSEEGDAKVNDFADVPSAILHSAGRNRLLGRIDSGTRAPSIPPTDASIAGSIDDSPPLHSSSNDIQECDEYCLGCHYCWPVFYPKKGIPGVDVHSIGNKARKQNNEPRAAGNNVQDLNKSQPGIEFQEHKDKEHSNSTDDTVDKANDSASRASKVPHIEDSANVHEHFSEPVVAPQRGSVSKELKVTYWATVECGDHIVQIPIEAANVSGLEKAVLDTGMKKVWKRIQDKQLEEKVSLQDAYDLAKDMHEDSGVKEEDETNDDQTYSPSPSMTSSKLVPASSSWGGTVHTSDFFD